MCVNRLMLGDNLEILKTIDSESVDLVYLDPPFFSNRNYEVIWGDAGEVRSFQDRWSGGIDQYIAWLKERVEQMHRVLKKTGSIFLHCDWHANAYIRVYILDKIFGEKNFMGEIVWQRTNAHNDAKKKLAVLSDRIWYYTKSGKFTYNPVYGALSDKYTDDFYTHDDGDGRGSYSLGDLTNTRPGGYNYEYKGYKPNKNGWRCPIETMRNWDEDGLIYFPKKKTERLRVKRYLSNSKGSLLGDVWTDIGNVQGGSKERIGYPTQKPEALMRRIIEMASDKGGIVLDPFMGGGTTIAVADKLERKWIGIDQSTMAVKVTDLRLQKQADFFSGAYTVQLHKYNYDTLRNKDAFEFETWIIGQFGGIAHDKKGGDLGIDGKTEDGVPIQVKRSDSVPRDVIDKFKAAIQRSDKTLFQKNQKAKQVVGYIIAFSFNKGAISEAARLKNEEGIIIKLVRVDEIIPVAPGPSLTVTVDELERGDGGDRRIEFIAKGQSDAGIEFYSWDFAYDEKAGFRPTKIMDNEGRQVLSLNVGAHKIAVKAIDNHGLESMEIVELKINGGVSRHGS